MRMNERRTKMSSVKRKLTNKTLVQKCEIIRHIGKGMTNKEDSERFGVLKNTIDTYVAVITQKLTKPYSNGLVCKEVNTYPLMAH